MGMAIRAEGNRINTVLVQQKPLVSVYVAAGIGIRLGMDFGAVLAFCSHRPCIEW